MLITETQLQLVEDDARVLAYVSIVMDGTFVVHDLKLISGGKGAFVAMPSRRRCSHCPSCDGRNHLRARFCNKCGTALMATPLDIPDSELHADIAHPLDQVTRAAIHGAIMRAYRETQR